MAFAVLAATISTSVAIVCPDGYTASGTKCLWFTTNMVSWSTTKAACEDKNGWLVSIKSSADQTSVVNSRPSTTDTYWIGLNDLVVEGSYRWLDGSMPYKDGTTLSGAYTNWNSGEPNNSGNDEDCATLRAEQTWNDQNCNTFMAKGICETWSCPDDWVNAGGGKCLYYRGTTGSWQTQQSYCESVGGTLVTMKSPTEGDLVWNKRTNTGIASFWIGLHDRFVEGRFN